MTLEPWRRKYELISGPYVFVRRVLEDPTTHAYGDASSMRIALLKPRNVQ